MLLVRLQAACVVPVQQTNSMAASGETRPPVPPFTDETAWQKVGLRAHHVHSEAQGNISVATAAAACPGFLTSSACPSALPQVRAAEAAWNTR